MPSNFLCLVRRDKTGVPRLLCSHVFLCSCTEVMDFDEYEYLEKAVESANLVKGSNGLGSKSRSVDKRRTGEGGDEAEDGYRSKCNLFGDGERESSERSADDRDSSHREKFRDSDRDRERLERSGAGRRFRDAERDHRDGERRRHIVESDRNRDYERELEKEVERCLRKDRAHSRSRDCEGYDRDNTRMNDLESDNRYAREKREKKEEAAVEQEADPEREQRIVFAFQAFEASLAGDVIDDFQLPITHRPTENLDTDNMEQASEDTQLTSSNVGFRLLQKMGWKGKGLGKDEQGMVEPIRAKSRDAKLGLGKQEQDDFYTAEENVHRKKLEVELEETEELVKRREVEAEREQKIQSEVKEIRKVFFCELCNKQYKLAMEFETHLSSYDHNHKKRFKEMREQQTSKGRDDRQKREQLRHEKELQRFAQLAEAQRQQQQPPPAPPPSLPDVEAGSTTTSLPTQDQRSAFKFGFASKPVASKMSMGGAAKKSKLVAKVAAVFQVESDGET